MTAELIKCSHCGYIFKTDLITLVKDGETIVARSILDFLKQKPRYLKTIDIKCPNCDKWFEYRIEP
jgi:uncharacterized C2H2 Zn-finger protein